MKLVRSRLRFITCRSLQKHWFLALLALLLGVSSTSVRPAAGYSQHVVHFERESGYSTFHSKGVSGWGRTLKALSAPPPSTEGPTISKTFIILAADRTARPDPLDNFKKYRDGWDIRNEHYFASVGFTAAPGFIIAAVWLALGVLLLLLACCCCCCCSDRAKGAHEGGTLLPLLFLFLFTGAAVAGCVILYIGEGRLRNELSDTLSYVVDQSNIVSTKLQNITTDLSNTKTIGVGQFSLTPSDNTKIQELNQKLSSAASTLQTKTKDNAQKIRSGLDSVRLAVIVVAGVMLLLVLLGLLFTVLGASAVVYLLVFIGWFLVAATWILCGVYILLNNAMGDTCIAMKDWVDNPSAKTNLDEILPCVDVDTANSTLQQTSKLTNETANGINGVITQLNRNTTIKLPLLCNPVQQNLSPSGCQSFADAPKAFEPYICGSKANTTCLPQDTYNQINVSVKTINDLYVQSPFLVNLADCQFVRQAFTTIRENNCHGLRKYTKWEYIGLILISGGAMFSIIFWICYTRRRRHRHHAHPYQNEAGQPIYGGAVQSEPKPM